MKLEGMTNGEVAVALDCTERTIERKLGRIRCALRSAIHEEPPVKTGARRSRDFPTIHSASSPAGSAMK
jgi:hypothetical protein